jgi:hypothetical protein
MSVNYTTNGGNIIIRNHYFKCYAEFLYKNSSTDYSFIQFTLILQTLFLFKISRTHFGANNASVETIQMTTAPILLFALVVANLGLGPGVAFFVGGPTEHGNLGFNSFFVFFSVFFQR